MNTSAIHHAVRLQKHPEDMAWLCYPDSDLPEGTTELLRIYSDKKQQADFARKNEFDETELSKSLFNFINNVIANENNSDAKLLGTDNFATLQLQHFHFELLQDIYQSEKQYEKAEEKLNLISSAYNRLEQKKNEQDGVISFTGHRNVIAKEQDTTKSTSQVSYFKTAAAIVSAISIFALVSMAGKFSETTPTNDFEITTELQEEHADAQKVLVVANQSTENTTQQLLPNISTAKPILQKLIKQLEMAYEKGDVKVIAPILANSLDLQNQTENPQQLHEKLNTLFEITAERKMVLYDFNWNNVSNTLEGKGKFLSRYQLVGESVWITRTGDALISANIIDNKLTISQLGLENPID